MGRRGAFDPSRLKVNFAAPVCALTRASFALRYGDSNHFRLKGMLQGLERLMFKVVSCIATAHDLRLVVIAGLVCFGVSVLACSLFDRAVRSERKARGPWLAAAAIAAGSGLWATHFIAMLSYRPGLPVGYDPVTVLAAWVVAVVGTGAAFLMLSQSRTWRARAVAGLAMGLAGAVMHYVAMAAFRTTGLFKLDPGYVVASVVTASAIAALGAAGIRSMQTWRGRMLGGLGLTLSIVAVHFIGMTALQITPDPRVLLNGGLISPQYLWVGVAGTVLLAVSMTALAILIHARTSADAAAWLHELIEAMPASLAYHDPEDRMVIWNRRYAEGAARNGMAVSKDLGYRESIEASVAAGLYPEAVGREAEWVDQHMAVRAANTDSHISERYRAGRWLRFEERRTQDGGLITVATDVTDLKAALARAEQADRAKTEFLSNLSHELRTPLNGVVGLGDVLSRTDLSDAQRRMVDGMLASAHNLTGLISSILDFSELQSGETPLKVEVFDPAEAAREAARAFAAAAQTKGLDLQFEARVRPGLRVTGDSGRLRQVLSNLISNAVKFTDAGSVRIVMHAEEGEGVRRLRYEVIDTGIGFDETQAERLFDWFEQADGSITRRFGGTGLGLALARRVAERLGGEVSASSAPGLGSTFTFALQLPAAPDGLFLVETIGEPEPQPEPEAPTSDEEQPFRVLLADDHPTNRQVVELILGATESDLTSVENGAEAVQAFQSGRYDLVLMDLQMPVMDGLTAMKAIREFEVASDLPRTPMIALTANVLAEHVAASIAAGADRHVGKPITATQLLEEIGKVFERQTAANDVADVA
jgi:signal transduction histidine kinase/NO-binding membrane sensor protein with MHYT domain/ActR/RegA family two-component response regulator